MSGNERNGRVVILLIAAMTVGAALLRFLETPVPRTGLGWPSDGLLAAQETGGIDHLTIEFVPSDAAEPAAYDGVIWADGRYSWEPQAPQARVAVVASPSAPLDETQGLVLLQLIRQLNRTSGLTLDRIELSLATVQPSPDAPLPLGARELRDLLARKNLVQ